MFCQKCGKEVTGNFCENCGTAVNASQPMPQPATQTEVQPPVQPPVQQPYVPQATPPESPKKVKNPIYKKWWFWVIIAFVLFLVIIGFGGGSDTNDDIADTSKGAITQTSGETNGANKGEKVTVADFSAMSKAEIEEWATANKVKCTFSEDYSDSVAVGSVISQSKNANDTVYEGDTIRVVLSKGKKPSVEYQNALIKAESYSKTMHMSKKGIYDQLTSEYGEGFPADAAQYAIDNLQADYKANALAKAKSYQENMHMSKNAIYEQLISEYGEQFTKEEAQYAIDHLND